MNGPEDYEQQFVKKILILSKNEGDQLLTAEIITDTFDISWFRSNNFI